jgi:hypothetical protein
MKHTQKMKRLLERMAAIEHMERGKICQMPGRKYYNLQVWRKGRNEVRYVPVQDAPEIQAAIAGYQLFCKLAEQYADEVIRMSRRGIENKKRGKQ